MLDQTDHNMSDGSYNHISGHEIRDNDDDAYDYNRFCTIQYPLFPL